MLKLYSQISPEKLLHIIYRKQEFDENPGREELVEAHEFLQCAALKMEDQKTFRAHKHNEDQKTTGITQESWVVIQGRVMGIYYDLDDEELCRTPLSAGDISITLRGGHNYKILSDNTLVYEFKTGPYFGQERDKTFI